MGNLIIKWDNNIYIPENTQKNMENITKMIKTFLKRKENSKELQEEKKPLEFDVYAKEYLGDRKIQYYTHLNGHYISLGSGGLRSLDYIATLINDFSDGRTDIKISSKNVLESNLSDLSWLKPKSTDLGPDEPLAKGGYSLRNCIGVNRPLSIEEMRYLMKKVLEVGRFHK